MFVLEGLFERWAFLCSTKQMIKENKMAQEYIQYKAADGTIFPTKNEAEAYEKKVLEFKYDFSAHAEVLRRLNELEEKVMALEVKVSILESKQTNPLTQNPWQKPLPYFPFQNPAEPYQGSSQPKPGDVLYEDTKNYQRVVMGEDGEMKVVHTAEDDERAFADGKTVVYAGHNRAVIDGPLTEPNPFAPNKQYFDWENDSKNKK